MAKRSGLKYFHRVGLIRKCCFIFYFVNGPTRDADVGFVCLKPYFLSYSLSMYKSQKNHKGSVNR